MDEDNKSQPNNGVALKELDDISYEAKKTQLQSLMGGKSQQTTYSLSDLLSSKAGFQSHDAWRLFSKAKNALEDGARLENLSWRLFHMKVSKENGKEDSNSKVDFPSQNDGSTSDEDMDRNIQDHAMTQLNSTRDCLIQNLSISSSSNLEYDSGLSSLKISASRLENSISVASSSGTPPPSFHMESIPSPFLSKFNTPPENSFNISMKEVKGNSLKNLDHSGASETISVTQEDIPSNFPDHKVCANCATSNTVLWRKSDHGSILCNACGLFFKLHGVNRPQKLKSDVIRKRNRKSKKEPISKDDSYRNEKETIKTSRIPKYKSNHPKIKKETELDSIIEHKDDIVVTKEYISTGKRARPDSDQGNLYSNPSAPFMYIPTPVSTLDPTISAHSSLNGSEATLQSNIKPINITNNSLLQNQHNWQSQSSPFSYGNHYRFSFNEYDSVQQNRNHQNNAFMDDSFPTNYYSAPTHQLSHFGLDSGISNPQHMDESTFKNFEKQPIYFTNTNKQSQLFQDAQHVSKSVEIPSSSVSMISPPVTNTLMTDIMFMSQFMANEDPLGRVSEMMVEDLYGFGMNNREYDRSRT